MLQQHVSELLLCVQCLKWPHFYKSPTNVFFGDCFATLPTGNWLGKNTSPLQPHSQISETIGLWQNWQNMNVEITKGW